MVEQLVSPVAARDLDDLSALLASTVNDGGSVSFMSPLSVEEARAFWSATLEKADPRAIFLAIRDEAGQIVATVQLHPAWAPNQPHRADVAKLLVHPSARRNGYGRALMEELERRAREAGFTLLTLDTVRDGAAEKLYARGGWTRAGVIPGYALDPGGLLCDTVIFFKQLA